MASLLRRVVRTLSERILFYDSLPGDFDVSQASRLIGDRPIVSENGDRISEWDVQIKDIELFLRTRRERRLSPQAPFVGPTAPPNCGGTGGRYKTYTAHCEVRSNAIALVAGSSSQKRGQNGLR
jgi:hypothetical protein